MKKKTVVLMFVLALSLSIVGCGNQTTTAEEPQQEQMEVETEQPEQTETEMEEPQQEQAELETEEPQQEESVETEPVYSSPDELYENALSVLDEVIDTEKLYTSEEFAELLPQIFDKIDDITFNPDLVAVAAQNFCQKITFILSKVFGKYFQKELNYISEIALKNQCSIQVWQIQ